METAPLKKAEHFILYIFKKKSAHPGQTLSIDTLLGELNKNSFTLSEIQSAIENMLAESLITVQGKTISLTETGYRTMEVFKL